MYSLICHLGKLPKTVNNNLSDLVVNGESLFDKEWISKGHVADLQTRWGGMYVLFCLHELCLYVSIWTQET